MAEGWARNLGEKWLAVQSAGIEAHGRNPRAIEVMHEAGVDISRQESTQLTDAMLASADVVVTVFQSEPRRHPSPGWRPDRTIGAGA